MCFVELWIDEITLLAKSSGLIVKIVMLNLHVLIKRNWGVSLRAGLYAHTAQALATRPVSAAIPYAKNKDMHMLKCAWVI